MSDKFIIKKRHATLLEVLIAMALTVIVLMTLTFFYREVGIIGTEIDRVKVQDFYMRFVENRLSDTLTKAIAPTDKAKDFVFFSLGDENLTKSGSQSLIFTFDNGVSLDKLFSNHVLARLYLDPQGHLTMAYWPSPKRWDRAGMPPMKKEILLDHVDSLEFAFFVAPEKSKDESINALEQGQEPEPKGDWRTQPWLRDFQQLPVLVKTKVILSDSKQELIFVFPLMNSLTHAVYD